ncbi:MAG: glycosyltransferase [Nanoarchaeota archaeon]
MRILQIEPRTNGPVNKDATGGMEQITYLLDKEFFNGGHLTTLIARSASDISGKLITIPDQWNDSQFLSRTDFEEKTVNAFNTFILTQDLSKYDIILNHMSDIFCYATRIQEPVVTIYHMSPSFFWDPALGNLPLKNSYFVAVSEHQKNLYQQAGHPVHKVITHGIDINAFIPGQKDDYLLFLGRLVPEKGVDIAIDVSIRTRIPLIIAGAPDSVLTPEREAYQSRIFNAIDNKQIHYVGPADLSKKKELLSRARALLVLTQPHNHIQEASSLVSMEALASGTPVIATNNGALPEIVDDGKTGFIRNSIEDLIDAVYSTDFISSATCRTTAEQRFSSRRMAQQYVQFFQELRGGI